MAIILPQSPLTTNQGILWPQPALLSPKPVMLGRNHHVCNT